MRHLAGKSEADEGVAEVVGQYEESEPYLASREPGTR